jgi:hypothetical protein
MGFIREATYTNDLCNKCSTENWERLFLCNEFFFKQPPSNLRLVDFYF